MKSSSLQTGCILPTMMYLLVISLIQLSCVTTLVDAWTCTGATVTASFTLSSGISTATNCNIQATITVTNNAELYVYTSTTNNAGRIRSTGPNSKVFLFSTTIGGDVEIQQGDVNITDSTVTGFGRIMGTSVSSGDATQSLLGVVNTVFQDTSGVLDQMTAGYVGLDTRGHGWSVSGCTFIGRGGIRINTLRMALLSFTNNDFSQFVRTPGSITTAITIVNSGLTYLTTFTYGTYWSITGNFATLDPLNPMNPIDVAGVGGIALINIGSMALPSGAAFVGIVIIAINLNVNFAQIVSGANSWKTPAVALSIPTFNNNSAAPITNAPSSLAVFDFGTMTFSGGTTFTVAYNTFDVSHSNSIDASGAVSLYAHPGQSSTTASSITVTSNTFVVTTAGGVDAAFVHYKSRGSSFYHSVGGVISGNVHTATTVNGRAVFMLVEGTSTFVGKSQSISALICHLYSQTAAALIATVGGTDLRLLDSGKIGVIESSIECHPLSSSALMTIIQAPKLVINHASAALTISSNAINLNNPATPSDILSLSPGGTELISGLLEFNYNVVSGCVASAQRVMSSVYSGTGNANGCGNRLCGDRIQTLRTETSGWVWSWCPTDTESISISPTLTKPLSVTPPSSRSKTSTPSMLPPPSTTPEHTLTQARTLTRMQYSSVTPSDTSTPSGPIRSSTLSATSSASQQPPLLLLPPSTDEDDTTTTGTVTVTAGAVVLGGSGLVADSASTIQITAIFTIMVCKANGGSTTTARLFLTPLRVADTPSADLIGSFIILISFLALYFLISAIVFTCIRKYEPKIGTYYFTPEGEEVPHTYSSASEVTARRIFRSKMFMYYPRLPVLVATLLFPGIVLESCGLMYGSLSEEAANWERFLGALGFVAALSFVAYEHIIAIFAQERVRSHALREMPDITSLDNVTSDTEDDEEIVVNKPIVRSNHHHRQQQKRRNLHSNADTTTSSTPRRVLHHRHHARRYARPSTTTTVSTSDGGGSLVRQPPGGSQIRDTGSDSSIGGNLANVLDNSTTLMEFAPPTHGGEAAAAAPTNGITASPVFNTSALSRSSLSHQHVVTPSMTHLNAASSQNPIGGLSMLGGSGGGAMLLGHSRGSIGSIASLAGTPTMTALLYHNDGDSECMPPSGVADLVSHGVHEMRPRDPNGSVGSEQCQLQSTQSSSENTEHYNNEENDTIQSSCKQFANHHGGEVPLDGDFSVVATPTHENWSDAMEGVEGNFSDDEFYDYDTNNGTGDEQHAPIVLAIREMSHPQEAILDPKTAPWFVEYGDMERAMQPAILQKTLLAVGHWNTFVYRSTYCVVVAFRPGRMVWVAAHNLWRMLLIGIIGAVNPSDADNCKYVQGTIIAVCFVHGLLIYITRVFRVPALNFLQGSQSILLGLLACSPFLPENKTQSVFANTLMALSITTVLLSLLAMILEVRVQRRQEDLRKEAWVSKFRAEEMEETPRE